jgi:hypothetical protein
MSEKNESESKQTSAYQFICDSLERMPGTPYAFQNPATAGKDDVTFSLFRNDMPPALQEKFAKVCCDELIVAVEQQTVTESLSNVLHSIFTFTYAAALLRRIKEYHDEGLLDRDSLYRFGLMLARERSENGDVKLGIYILSLFPNDIAKAIMRTLGLHSEFTLPVILSVETWPGANSFIFDLARDTTGYGRLAASLKFAPLTPNKQEWFFYDAIKTPVCRDVIATHALSSVDMESFYEAISVDETVFHALSRLFTYAFLETDVKAYALSKMLVEKYMAAADQYVKKFIDLAALVMIDNSMRPSWTEAGVDAPKENGWSSNVENRIREQCEKYKHSQEFRQARLMAEMDSPVEDNAVITHVLKSYAFDYSFPLPVFSAFAHMLDSDPFDMDIGEFVLVDHPKEYAGDVAERILAVTPHDVLNNPEILDKDSLTPEHRPDVWLIYLLKARKVVKFECERICLSCLSARYQELRIEAMNALRLTRAQWSGNVIPALERACETEPDPKIVKRIKRLLGIKVDDKKEQRYVDVADIAITPSAADKTILDTEIAGTFFRDMDVVTGVLESGDTLFLKREPDNKYDSNAILVTTEDGYVLGYIPKVENPPLAQFMDAGEKLYAVLEVDPGAYEGKPPITVMVSKAPAAQGKVIQFPGGLHR